MHLLLRRSPNAIALPRADGSRSCSRFSLAKPGPAACEARSLVCQARWTAQEHCPIERREGTHFRAGELSPRRAAGSAAGDELPQRQLQVRAAKPPTYSDHAISGSWNETTRASAVPSRATQPDQIRARAKVKLHGDPGDEYARHAAISSIHPGK